MISLPFHHLKSASELQLLHTAARQDQLHYIPGLVIASVGCVCQSIHIIFETPHSSMVLKSLCPLTTKLKHLKYRRHPNSLSLHSFSSPNLVILSPKHLSTSNNRGSIYSENTVSARQQNSAPFTLQPILKPVLNPKPLLLLPVA